MNSVCQTYEACFLSSHCFADFSGKKPRILSVLFMPTKNMPMMPTAMDSTCQHATKMCKRTLKMHTSCKCGETGAIEDAQMTLLYCCHVTRSSPFSEAFFDVFTSCWHAILAPVHIVGMFPCCIESLAYFLSEFCGEIGETTGRQKKKPRINQILLGAAKTSLRRTTQQTFVAFARVISLFGYLGAHEDCRLNSEKYILMENIINDVS